MAKAKVESAVLLRELLEVFRAHGYEGATLGQIAAATGLEKASLYHRFPRGKEEMAEAILESLEQWFRGAIGPILASGDRPQKKVERMIGAWREFYAGGGKTCVLDSLSLAGSPEAVRGALERRLAEWVSGLAQVFREAGVPAAEAKERAEQAMVQLEGALVVSRVTGQTGAFERAMRRVKELVPAG